MILFRFLLLFSLSLFASSALGKEVIGSVDTEFKLLGSNHKIIIEVFDDPLVNGVSCYVSSAKTGGVMGFVGLAEDTSDASVACRQVGEISFNGSLPKQEEAFKKSSSPLFKKTRVVRVVDSKRNTLIYLVYSDKLIDGSPNNSITAVPINIPIPLK